MKNFVPEPDGSIHNMVNNLSYLYYAPSKNTGTVCLDGDFNAEELRELVEYMDECRRKADGVYAGTPIPPLSKAREHGQEHP